MAQPADRVSETNRHFWNTRDKLGHGATGAVYVGYERSSGERRAVKVFAGSDFKSLKREIDVVSSLPPHDNIVRLYGVEDEVKSPHHQVIIMELCTGSSLYELIDSPDNAYGLSETEFKQVIYDVAKGLQHLRRHHFVHRDIKPGNIMRCQKPDGSYIFKLADFGTARELAPGETFISLHGTEEYLYPGMYERALINPNAKSEFAAKVDLWSVGATFFHAATGYLPFQPFKKREDRALMFRIISEKEPGVISGQQLEENGRIIYCKTLPKNTRLSQGLSELMTAILGGMMENNLRKIMEFDDLFREIERIHCKKVVDVFCVYSCSCRKIFIDPEERAGLAKLKELIHAQTNLDPKYQEIFYENLPYKPATPIMASQLPVTTAERPLFVFGGDPKKTSELEMLTPPVLPPLPKPFHPQADMYYGKECAKIIHYYKFITEEINRLYKLMHQAALCFRHTVMHEYSLVKQHLDSVGQLNKATCRVLSSQVAGLINIKDTLSAVNQSTDGMFAVDISKLDLQIRQKNELIARLKDTPLILQKKSCHVMQEGIVDSWDAKYSAAIFEKSTESMQFLVKNVENNFRSLVKDRRMKALGSFDQTVHNFTKMQLREKLEKGQDRVITLQTGRQQVYSKLGEWFNQMTPMRCDVEDIGKKTKQHAEECSRHLTDLDKWEETHILVLNGINQRVKDVVQQLRHHSSLSSRHNSQVELPEKITAKAHIQKATNLTSELTENKGMVEVTSHQYHQSSSQLQYDYELGFHYHDNIKFYCKECGKFVVEASSPLSYIRNRTQPNLCSVYLCRTCLPHQQDIGEDQSDVTMATEGRLTVAKGKHLDPIDIISFVYEAVDDIFFWKKHEFMMKFQHDCLPPDISSTNINISVSLWGNFELPENTLPVSAFFNIQCPLELLKDAYVKIEHCARDVSNLKFAISSDICPPYKFELVKEGIFFDRHGEIQRKSFSRFVIVFCYAVASWFYPFNYHAALCSNSLDNNIWTIHLYVTWCTASHIIFLESEVNEKELVIKDQSVLQIHDQAEYIEIDPSVSSENRAKGLDLIVYPKNNIHINRRDIDNIFCYGIASASFRLKLTEPTATTFGQHYCIEGAVLNNHYLYLSLSTTDVEPVISARRQKFETRQGREYLSDMAITDGTTFTKDSQPTLRQLKLLESGEEKIKIMESVCPQWKTIGTLMDFDDLGSKISLIEEETSNLEDRLIRVLRLWLNGESRTYKPASWRTLILLLKDCGYTALAEKLNMHFK